MRVQVPIKQEHIDKGIPGAPGYCAIALAFKELYPKEPHIGVGTHGDVYFDGISKFKVLGYEAQLFVKRFDRGYHPLPTFLEYESK